MPEDFFDDFQAGSGNDQPLFTDADFDRLRELFLNKSLSLDELHPQYKQLLEELLESRGHSVEWAQQQHKDYPFVAAYSDAGALELLRDEAVAAERQSKCMKAKEEWVPPPEDEEPETAADYE